MQANYKPFIDRLIRDYEGGYGWNKKDSGGPTKYGITCFDLAEHRHEHMTSMTAWAPLVRAMTLAEAEEIYETKYAKPFCFNDLPSGPDVVGFDYGVNSGLSRPVLVWRRLLKVEGGDAMDLKLLKAVERVDPRWLIVETCAERLRFMHAIRGGSAWVEFGKGWQKRVNDVELYGKQLLAGGSRDPVAIKPDAPRIGTPKAVHAGGSATGGTAGGVIAAGTAAHLGGAPWWGVAAVCGAIVVAGVGYEILQERQANAANRVVHV